MGVRGQLLVSAPPSVLFETRSLLLASVYTRLADSQDSLACAPCSCRSAGITEAQCYASSVGMGSGESLRRHFYPGSYLNQEVSQKHIPSFIYFGTIDPS